MKKLLFILCALPSMALAGGPKNTYPTPRGLDDEIQNIYHDIKNPIINYGSASSFTVTSLSVSTITSVSSATFTNLSATSITVTTITPTGIVGTTTNNNANVGNVGEYVESIAANVNYAANNVYGDITSITLTAGDWDLTGQLVEANQAGTITQSYILISTNTGNNGNNIVNGVSSVPMFNATSATDSAGVIANLRKPISATTIFYLKEVASFNSTAPKGSGILSARRKQ